MSEQNLEGRTGMANVLGSWIPCRVEYSGRGYCLVTDQYGNPFVILKSLVELD